MLIKVIIIREKINWKFSDAHFQKLEQKYGISSFLPTGKTPLNLLFREKIAEFFSMFSWIGRTMLNSTVTFTQRQHLSS